MKELKNAHAILTGASRGLGVYMARTLAREGVNLTLVARSAEGLEKTRGECAGVEVRTVPCDLTSRDDLDRLVREAEDGLGPVDVLVNNAGLEIPSAFTDLPLDDLDQLIQLNLSSVLWLCHKVLPGMIERGKGVIVNIASMAGKGPTPYNVTYSATKAALVGFTHSLAAEVEGTGVEVSVVNPSFVSESGMWSDRNGKAPRAMKEVSPERVAAATLKAIRGCPEVHVTAGPIRPLLALGQLAPAVPRWFVRKFGVTDALRDAVPPREAKQEPRPQEKIKDEAR